MKANKMTYFSSLFDNVLYMFRTCPLSIIRNISKLYTRNRYFVMLKFQRWVKLLMSIHVHCGYIVKHVVGKILYYIKKVKIVRVFQKMQ